MNKDNHLIFEALQQSKNAKPDYLDMDKDGNKKEPMKKAIHDMHAKHDEDEETHCKYADQGCDCDGCAACKDNYETQRIANGFKPKHEEAENSASKFNSKQVKMLVNNALRNVFAAIETLEGAENIPYDGDLDALVMNLEEEFERMVDVLAEKMPESQNKRETFNDLN